MRRHRLRMLKRASIAEVGRNPRRPKCMVSDRSEYAGCGRAPADHKPSRLLVHGLVGEGGGVMSGTGPEQPALAVFGDTGCTDVGVQRLGKRVMARHCVLLAAFL